MTVDFDEDGETWIETLLFESVCSCELQDDRAETYIRTIKEQKTAQTQMVS